MTSLVTSQQNKYKFESGIPQIEFDNHSQALSMDLELVTWNVNGLRSFPDDTLRTRWDSEFPSQIFCIQETKITRDMLDDRTGIWPDTSSYFAFSRKRSGYSGVATFCKSEATPDKAEEGLCSTLPSAKYEDALGTIYSEEDFTLEELKNLDAEGRAVITMHSVLVTESKETKKLILFNLYCPRNDPERPERERFKLDFYQVLEHRAKEFDRKGYFVVICGDINTSHKEIDHCDPYEEFGESLSRKWMDNFLGDDGKEESPTFYDAFRLIHPEEKNAFTCWNTKINARSNNYGTRIDYFFINRSLKQFVQECKVMAHIEGSDHCPVKIKFSGITPIPSSKHPSFSTKYYPELSGKQTTLKSYFAPTKRKTLEDPSKKLPHSKRYNQQQSKLTNFFICKDNSNKISNKENPLTEIVSTIGNNSESVSAWKALLATQSTKQQPPNCPSHNEPSVLRTVKKKGPNTGRQFWCCARGEGRADDSQARCDFFSWVKK
ncbi:DNA-(apurinic or apyrimidinic site) endonuclease 2 [Lepeophtheirus salmonis]|uniref:DNA-(apurinic or apyrimidinic site) endonuclease 2 n=1 Tax=Lepeophtheirus salmonis TaxID=72036 RepID=UPI001AE40607|nr:DNA-(apurinic or apyrimidinic site) endonuclease 2-like [Lepeophtheirus salmonis]